MPVLLRLAWTRLLLLASAITGQVEMGTASTIQIVCNFKHEGPQGGGKRKDPFTSLLTSGNSKKARKNIVSLLINDFKESLSQDGSETQKNQRGEEKKPDADDDNVYRLLRGAPTLIVARSNLDVADYRPR